MGPQGLQRYEQNIMVSFACARAHTHTHTQEHKWRYCLIIRKHIFQVLQRAPQAFVTSETRTVPVGFSSHTLDTGQIVPVLHTDTCPHQQRQQETSQLKLGWHQKSWKWASRHQNIPEVWQDMGTSRFSSSQHRCLCNEENSSWLQVEIRQPT